MKIIPRCQNCAGKLTDYDRCHTLLLRAWCVLESHAGGDPGVRTAVRERYGLNVGQASKIESQTTRSHPDEWAWKNARWRPSVHFLFRRWSTAGGFSVAALRIFGKVAETPSNRISETAGAVPSPLFKILGQFRETTCERVFSGGELA
jgi:hypothetical protein